MQLRVLGKVVGAKYTSFINVVMEQPLLIFQLTSP